MLSKKKQKTQSFWASKVFFCFSVEEKIAQTEKNIFDYECSWPIK